MPVKRYRTPLAVLALLFGSDVVLAQDQEDIPDDAFLEFLGEWESDGEWVDPLEFEQFELAERADKECESTDQECMSKRRDSDES
ncbi:MAG: hypothetical protein AAF438_16255 [Pseudomonadota bacterium]